MSALQRVLAAISMLVVALIPETPARAANFTVFPISISLDRKVHSQTLTLHNESSDPIRFQLSAFAWDQLPDGQMMLKPTDDVVFFPQLLTIRAGEDRKVRVGLTAAPATTEKTYRLFVEELAPEERPQHADTPQVLVLTKMGIPIFLEPILPVPNGAIDSMQMDGGKFSFALKNSGNVHFSIDKVRVSGWTGDSTVFSREATGWYVLAGEKRIFELPIPNSDCQRIERIQVDARTDKSNYEAVFAIPANACRSAD